MNTTWGAEEAKAAIVRAIDLTDSRRRADAFDPPTEPERRTIAPWVRPRASGIHKCARALVLEAGMTGQENIIELAMTIAFAFGAHIHGILQGCLDGEAEKMVSSDHMDGHVDLWDSLTENVTEIKTINARDFAGLKAPVPGHRMQASWYGWRLGARRVIYVYVGKSTRPDGAPAAKLDEASIKCFVEPLDVELAQVADEKARQISEHVRLGTLPGYVEIPECRRCQVKLTCARSRIDSGELRIMGSKVNGTTFRDLDLAVIGLTVGERLRLDWEPDNRFDRDAGRVLPGTDLAVAVRVLREDGTHLGYLPANGAAPIVAAHIRDGGIALAEISELTGGVAGKENRGLNLRLTIT